MRRHVFALAALAIIATACSKEYQPESQNPEAKGDVKSEIRISVPDTKVAIAEQTGVCTWQEGDKIAIFFATALDEENEPTEGVRVEFTYDGLYEDGSAKFVTDSAIPTEYVSAQAVYPTASMTETGGNTLVRDYIYNAGSVPVYLKGKVVKNEDGSLSSHLSYNASVMKFTLHDIPAYAAGFVLVSKRPDEVQADGNVKTGATIKITTSFPYKTGYTSDPANYDNDIVLYSAVAHTSVPQQVYLIDGDGDVIEGSEKKFTGDQPVTYDDFIVMPRIDFKKANLRKDFVKVCDVKWAKGNLQCFKDNGTEGFQDGWRLAPAQWYHFNYDLASNVVDKVEYTYDDTKGTEMRYSNNGNQFEHFNFGGLARNARFYSTPGTNYMVPEKELNISGKIFTDSKGNTEATGDARFYDCGTFSGKNSQIWGDLAFWASKGKFRVPTKEELSTLYSSKLVSKQYGHYDTGDYNVWGILFTTALGEQVINKTDVVLTDADLESGLFLPLAGRRRYDNSGYVMTVRTQGVYWSGAARWNPEKYPAYTNHATILQLKGATVEYGFTLHATQFQNSTGCLIRPVLVEESAE